MVMPEPLPGPHTDFWDWQLQGACRGADSSLFFHPDGERGHDRLHREQRAKALCRRCPVLTDCRAHALRVGEAYGIWGGQTESQRAAVLRSGRDGYRSA